ncbi:unnamed protein product, partial [Iphiclides podalirius]
MVAASIESNFIQSNLSEITSDLNQYRINTEERFQKTNSPRISRSAYGKGWSSKSFNYGPYNGLPPYLVYNRKLGSYYPYYPKQYSTTNSNIRRNAMKKMSNQRQWSH